MSIPYWRLSGLYFFYFALLGAVIPFWNLYLSEAGLNARQIGLLGAILLGTKIVSPYLIGSYSDRSANPMRVIHWTNFFAFAGFLCIFFIPTVNGLSPHSSLDSGHAFLWLSLVILFFSFFWNGVIAQYEAVTLLNLGAEYHRYGSIRVWGSAGFIFSVTLLGWLFERVSLHWMPSVLAVMLALIWLSSLTLNNLNREVNLHLEVSTGFLSLVRQKHILAVFLVCLLMKFSFGTYYTFYTIYLVQYGFSESTIALLWSISVFSELLLFLIAGHFIIRFSIKSLLVFCCAVSLLRWVMIGTAPESISLLIFAQLLHAINFALYHATAIEWVRRAFGEHYMGRGQAVYSAVSFGLGGAIGALICGLLWTDELTKWWVFNWYLSAFVAFLGLLTIVWIKIPHKIN